MEYLLWTGDEIIERVDEYALYCSYLGFEPLIGAKYVSPLRSSTGSSADTDPSFGIFERKYGHGNHEFRWKDQALGLHGDVFDLVQILCKLRTKREAYMQVLIDAGIAPGLVSRPIVDSAERKYRGYAKLSYKERDFTIKDLAYWGRINVERERLLRYKVHSIAAYWLYEDQQYPKFPKGVGFAYHIWDKKQFYFPWEVKKHKFRTDWTEACVPGFLQLRYDCDTLIITKSYKDVVCSSSFGEQLGFDVVAARGESILIPEPFINHFKQKYRRIYTLFDNDGKHKGPEYKELWNIDMLQVPKLRADDKDTTDFCTNHGAPETREMLRQIISL